jgi:hypothetical protein
MVISKFVRTLAQKGYAGVPLCTDGLTAGKTPDRFHLADFEFGGNLSQYVTGLTPDV